ncbi:MAG: hypothetical protein HN341_19670 [Verrucomicrobia bacterium]|nr:hypothetical protein [Verrucomicrobiota bacterium]
MHPQAEKEIKAKDYAEDSSRSHPGSGAVDIVPPEVIALGVGGIRVWLAYSEDLLRDGGIRGRVA